MRKLVVFASTLKPLPHDRFLSMRLTYRDDVTPEAYEPQFFQKAKESLDKHCSTNKVTLGNVATEFHGLDLTFQSSPGQTQRPASQGSKARTPAATIPPENSGPRAGGSSRLDSSRATSAQRSVISPDLSDFAVDPGAKKLSRSEYIRIVDIIKNIGSPIVRIRDMRARVRRETNVHLSTGTIRRLTKNNVLLKLSGSLAGAFEVLKRTASSSKAGRKGPASMSASDRAGAVSRLDSRATPRRSARLKRKASTTERPIAQNQRRSKRRAPSHPLPTRTAQDAASASEAKQQRVNVPMEQILRKLAPAIGLAKTLTGRGSWENVSEVTRATWRKILVKIDKRLAGLEKRWDPSVLTSKDNKKRYRQVNGILLRAIKLLAVACWAEGCGKDFEDHTGRRCELDHQPERGKKLFNPAYAVCHTTILAIAEWHKCEVVCRECNRC